MTDKDTILFIELQRRLNLITRAALNRIDGDSQPNDTYWGEIIGIAEGDPNWLQHAKANYEVKRAGLVKFAETLVESVIEQLSSDEPGPVEPSQKQYAAEYIADQIEQELLPAMVLAEDGRTFRRSQGQPSALPDGTGHP